jgi:glycosyltransferase involved in cell wall biosynthesis
MLRPRVPELRVLVAGEGPEREHLEALISAERLEETVKLLGYRPKAEMPDVLQAFDVAASSSDFEGTPLSMLEYMEAGLPIVSTRVGGVPDVVVDGVNGLLVERRDPDALATALEGLLRDPARAREMGRLGRERHRTEFDVSVTVRRMERLYEELSAAAARRDAGVA